jgi:hypothetical protein
MVRFININKLTNIMLKRGQITLFVIVGIVIIVALLIGIIMRSQLSDILQGVELAQGEAAKAKSLEIENYAEGCLEKISTEALINVFAQGGYYEVKNGVELNTFVVPYYLDKDEEEVPSLSDLEKSLSQYIAVNLDKCVKSFSSDLDVGRGSVDVSLGNNVQIEVKQTLGLEMDDSLVRVKSYGVVLDADVNGIYNKVIMFFNEVKEIETDLVGEGLLALKNEYKFYNPVISDEEIIFILSFDSLGRTLDYNFALKYPESSFEEGDVIFDLINLDSEIGVFEEEKEEEEVNAPQMDEETVNEMHEFFAELEDEDEE